MKKLLFCLCLFGNLSAFAQHKVTFEVEELSKPEGLVRMQSYREVWERLILSDVELRPFEVEENNINYPFDILARSEAPDSLIYSKYNPFFNGMYGAYAEHRPFVLSPDMIWLLISQGFARHVKANQDSLRHCFVDFSGKLSLIVEADMRPEDPAFPWERTLCGFTGQIEKYTGKKLAGLLTGDFSTTTPSERIASEVTVMEAVKPYFEFIVMYIVCGIPEITLEGTPGDWKKVLNKARKLKEYGLEWWISELEPLLEEFVKASKGEVDKAFWRNMFKYHSQEKYGAPEIIDGWIVKFFPYDKDGKRNNLERLEGRDCLPSEIVKVDLKFLEVRDGEAVETPLELWAGFVGLEQNKDNFALRPRIGWMVRKKDVRNRGLKSKLEADADSGISIRVKEFPAVLLELKKIRKLEIAFVDEIDIPDELAAVQIKLLMLSGKITEEGVERIRRLFPDTAIQINGNRISERQ